MEETAAVSADCRFEDVFDFLWGRFVACGWWQLRPFACPVVLRRLGQLVQ